MLFQCDLPPLLLPFHGNYDAHLNSEDMHDPELPLEKARAHGGTMVMWHTSLTPYITVLPSVSSSYQSILLKLPGVIPSIHTALYLPTAGREEQFFSSLVELGAHLDEVTQKYPDAAIFLRGDANVNCNNAARASVFSYFCSTFSLKNIPLLHPTYHHFVGEGNFDSEIDVLLVNGTDKKASESLDKIVCKLDSPFVNSQHDVILSKCCLPNCPVAPPNQKLEEAPKIDNDRIKIIWDEEVIRYPMVSSTPFPP